MGRRAKDINNSLSEAYVKVIPGAGFRIHIKRKRYRKLRMLRGMKAILFDMGSTLLEFENSSWDVLARVCAERSYEFLKKNGLNLPEFESFSGLLESEFLKAQTQVGESLRELKFEKVARDLFHRLNLSTADGLYDNFLEAYYQPVTDQITLIEGAVEVLQHFKGKALKLAVVSNTIFPERFHIRELRRFGLYPYLDLCVFSSAVGVKKPHPEIFLRALNELGVRPSEAVFVGDRLVEDVGGAQMVGMKTILRYHRGRDYSAPLVPDAQIKELNQLPKAVAGLFKKPATVNEKAQKGDFKTRVTLSDAGAR